MSIFNHSVRLDEEKCVGCTNCIKRCPTQAIRVRDGKAAITEELCIDCGECIRICPHHAKKAFFDSFDELNKFKYKIALPPPSLYGQFNNLDDVDRVLTALIGIGFDDVFEVARAAEIVSDYTRKYLAENKTDHPILSTACPVVIRLIQIRYPYLAPYLLDLLPPVELAAKMARADAMKKFPELKSEDIGIFFITPCPAKVSYVRNPIGVEKSDIDGVLSMSEAYFRLVPEMRRIKRSSTLSRSGVIGISWATTGGEAAALLGEKYLAADGMENVTKVLNEIENDNFSDLQFIELNACAGGCVGGVMTVENPFIAKARIQQLRRYLPVSQNRASEEESGEARWESGLKKSDAALLGTNMEDAIRKKSAANSILSRLPGLDCGACGAPSCKALAEDIVCGSASESDCIFIVREKLQAIYSSLAEIEKKPGDKNEK